MTVSTDIGAYAVTPGPILVAQAWRRDVDEKTAVCNGDECSVYDVSSSLITVITLPDATSTPRPPYANGSDTASSQMTGTAPGTGHVSATTAGHSTHHRNDTTTITSRTVSIITMAPSGWLPWSPNLNASAAGTGDRPLSSMNATKSFRPGAPLSWTTWQPIPTKGPAGNSSLQLNSTLSTFPSYVTTQTFVFADTTIVIPFLPGYAPTLRPDATTKELPSSTSSYETSGRISSFLSTSSCWTTDAPSVSSTQTMMGNSSTKICWLLECDENHSCTDQISRYPITVDGVSTSMAAPSANNTAATTPDPTTGNTDHQSMWVPWPTPSDGSGNSHSAVPSDAPLSSGGSVDGTITRTVIPLPKSTSEPEVFGNVAMMKRKRYVMERSQFKAPKEEQETMEE